MQSTANIVESYYLETRDGLFFAVKGLEHPPDRLISVVRYAPDPAGQRTKNGIAYRRLYHFGEQEQFLRSSYPHYLEYDPVFGATLQSVPYFQVRQAYDPRARLGELRGIRSPKGPETDVAAFAGLLKGESGIPWSAIGVSGSLLIGLHLNSSDLDLSIFGTQSCRAVYEALGRLRSSSSSSGVRQLDGAEIEDLYRQRGADAAISAGEFARLERGKLCQGSFQGRPYFVRFVRDDQGSAQRYGDVRYAKLGRATILATIADHADAIFTPCNYRISNVCPVEGESAPVEEMVSFRGRFCEQAKAGDRVRASGAIERLEHASGETRYRLLLGNFPEDAVATVSSL